MKRDGIVMGFLRKFEYTEVSQYKPSTDT